MECPNDGTQRIKDFFFLEGDLTVGIMSFKIISFFSINSYMIQCAYRFCLYHNCNCVSHIKNDTSPYIALGSASCNVMACGLLQLWEHLSLLFMCRSGNQNPPGG